MGKDIELSDDEVEDIRFALARLADHNDDLADELGRGDAVGTLREQAERFRRLAIKVTEPE